ncbi:MAG: MogA/MoaB family molybdenum cofactor biosynthesis protein [Desulfovibrio sp.]|nr:MogA/MoaB family molybdenum cofactor biosynthesis protein [Desulfovibrio sp.]
MTEQIIYPTCQKKMLLPWLPLKSRDLLGGKVCLRQDRPYFPPIPEGTTLSTEQGQTLFQVKGHLRLPTVEGQGPLCPLLEAQDFFEGISEFIPLKLQKSAPTLAWITLSDRGARGEREDKSGPAIQACVEQFLTLSHSQGFLLPDESNELRALLLLLALQDQYDLIITTGGTGLTSRDITPQTTARLLDLPLPGFTQAMMAKSLSITPKAVLSRAEAGVLGPSLIINLPGSVKAVKENLEAILPALEHTLAKLHNEPSLCGG